MSGKHTEKEILKKVEQLCAATSHLAPGELDRVFRNLEQGKALKCPSKDNWSPISAYYENVVSDKEDKLLAALEQGRESSRQKSPGRPGCCPSCGYEFD